MNYETLLRGTEGLNIKRYIFFLIEDCLNMKIGLYLWTLDEKNTIFLN
jgi:hypothetical protein